MEIVYIKLIIVRAHVKLSISIVLQTMFSAVSVFTIDILNCISAYKIFVLQQCIQKLLLELLNTKVVNYNNANIY